MTTTPQQASSKDLEDLVAVSAFEGASPFIGLTPAQLVAAAGRWAAALGRHPTVLLSDILRLASEQARVAAGVSTVAPEAGDRRFTDGAWRQPGWRRVSQAYLAW